MNGYNLEEFLRLKEERIVLYQQRVEDGLDIFTGKPSNQRKPLSKEEELWAKKLLRIL